MAGSLVFSGHGAKWLVEVQPPEDRSQWNPLAAADTLFNERLSGNADLIAPLPSEGMGIWNGLAPSGVGHPSISYGFYSAVEPIYTLGGPQVIRMIYLVAGWDQEDGYDNLYPLWPLMYATLDMGGEGSNGPLSTPYGEVTACTMLEPWQGQVSEEDEYGNGRQGF